jgi:hypothetical protein
MTSYNPQKMTYINANGHLHSNNVKAVQWLPWDLAKLYNLQV